MDPGAVGEPSEVDAGGADAEPGTGNGRGTAPVDAQPVVSPARTARANVPIEMTSATDKGSDPLWNLMAGLSGENGSNHIVHSVYSVSGLTLRKRSGKIHTTTV